MALIAPLAGAALGGVLTGGAGWAMSAGWLIGSWLFQEKNDEQNQIFDPGAQEMPRFNQALRGATMPVLFGTNRVSSQVVWQKNFTTIRHESTQGGGGGKGGGSGMGSKGGGPSSTQVTYEYKWDLMFHLGMGGDDFSLFGGWLGSERLNGETLLAIINNSNSGFGGGLFRSQTARPQNAALTFDEGYFHGNQSPDDANATNWDHFETEEGQPFRFPFTSYIGFKQLNLGGQAVVPQLSWEVGPGNIELTFDPAFDDIYTSHSLETTSAKGPSGGLIRGEDGKLYHFDLQAGNNLGRLRDISTGVTKDTFTDTEFDAAATALGLDPGTAYSFTDENLSGTMPNQNYILMGGQDIGAGTRSNWAFILFKVNESGVLEAVGGSQHRSNSLEDVSGPVTVGVYGEGTDDDPILIMSTSQVGLSFTYHALVLPSVNQMKAVTLEDGTNNRYDSRMIDLQAAVSEITNNFGNHSSHRDYVQGSFGFFLPVVNIGLLGPEWTSKIFFYIGKSDIEWHNDNPADTAGTNTIYNITGTYPNGGLFSVGLNADNPYSPSVDAAWTDETANWIDAVTELSVIPFADSGRLSDETTIRDGSDYDPCPAVQKLTTGAGAGATLVTFFKSTAPADTDRIPAGPNTFTQVQAFLWNPLDGIAKRYVKKSGSFADTSSDWGAGYGNYTQQGTSGYFDESTGELYISGGVDGGGTNDQVFVSTLGTFDIGGGEDVYPPYIIREILTSTVFGMGLAAANINQASYELALLYCETEGIKVSTQYRREEGALNAINDLLALYGGFLIDSGGEIKFGLQKFTASGDLVRTIDNDHLLVEGDEAPVRVTRGARQDTYNKVKVNYFDRDLEYRQNFVEISDEVDMDLHGVRAQEFPAKFVMKEGVATKLAVRALWSNLYARDIYDFKLGPKDADLEPGDVITLVDSFHSTLQSGKQVRITQWVENEPLKFSVKAVDEVQYVAEAELDASSQTNVVQNALFGPALPAADFTMYELPYEFQGADAQVYVGYRQQSAAKGARLYTSADGVSFAQVQEVQPFIISGIIPEPMPSREPGYVEENMEVYLMPDTATGNWSPSSNTFVQTIALDDVSASGRALGGGLMFIGSEMLAYEGVNLMGQNHYKFDKVYRGWGGTHISDHGSGESWHKHGGGIFTQAINEDKIGTVVHYKVAPFNFAGVEYDISSVEANTYAVQGTFFRPQNGSEIQTFVQSPGSFLTVQSEDLGWVARKKVIAGGSPIQFEWFDAARARGYGARAYGNGGYGRFEQDTNSVGWQVEVLSSDLSTVVRCVSVYTPAYLYDVDTNSTDFNAWTGSITLRVTPFNEFGTALRSRTKTLELFE